MIKFISVDLQYDFTRPKGKHFKRSRTSLTFVRNTLIPFFKKEDIKVGEIISDYRQPRPGDLDDSCRPGEWGYMSEIPEELVDQPRWVKCMNSPFFSRENIGVAGAKPGYPRERPTDFYVWLQNQALGPEITIVLFGLTLDCCVLCTAQAIRFRGYDVKILMEATDTYTGDRHDKKEVMDRVVRNWAKPITWGQCKEMIASEGVLKP